MSADAATVVEVLPFDGGGRVYSYAVPEALRGKILPGQLVRVPLGRASRLGVVWPTVSEGAGRFQEISRIRPIQQLCRETPVLSADLPRLATWIARYYAASLNSVLETVLPVVVRQGVRVAVEKKLGVLRRLDAVELEALRRRAPRQAALYDFLARQTGAVDRSGTLRQLSVGAAACAALVERGIVGENTGQLYRDAYDDELGGGELAAATPPVLNSAQQGALDAVLGALSARRFHSHLLHGVTGSGKTEVYLGAIRSVVAQGGSAIFLVPEVALTPQTVGRLRQRLADSGTRVVVWHSHLSAGERFDAWMAMARGEARVVAGARSAVFAPVKDLRLVVVDEEHEPSYKQGETPLYHARDVAVYRASLNGAVALLGSATPSLESMSNVRSGKYGTSSLPARVDDRGMPPMRILDMRRELLHMRGPQRVLARPLVDALRLRLERREQSILFLNRRGFARMMICPDCGHVAGCAHCSLALTHHRSNQTLRCHACGHTAPVPSSCPVCHSPKFNGRGAGTQKLEAALLCVLPQARVVRLDADTMGRKNLFREVLSDFRKGKTDILLGTQMLAKGLDFPNVTLVGIVDADLSLHVPDFRAAERTFQLLVQVSGRAGRGDRAGEVFVQTFTPGAAPVQFAKRADFEGFLGDELERRREHGYPPARHLIRHLFRGRNGDKVAFGANGWVQFLEANMPPGLVEIRGPAACAVERLQDNYRWNVWYFTERVMNAVSLLCELRTRFTFPPDVSDVLDVDAVDVG
ncbi:MAG: primosomal protein N' [Puniceicoccales bacterium]|jgi:primosomal protein N' (replication factor Y)|nr:primosomal protein N' [Puniceicoccales bacterium]